MAAVGDELDGRTISGVDMRTEGLSEVALTFRADFDDGAKGIYLVTLPEPSVLLGSLTGFATLLALARRRRHGSPADLLVNEVMSNFPD